MEAIKFVFGDLELTDEVINRLAALGYTPPHYPTMGYCGGVFLVNCLKVCRFVQK